MSEGSPNDIRLVAPVFLKIGSTWLHASSAGDQPRIAAALTLVGAVLDLIDAGQASQVVALIGKLAPETQWQILDGAPLYALSKAGQGNRLLALIEKFSAQRQCALLSRSPLHSMWASQMLRRVAKLPPTQQCTILRSQIFLTTLDIYDQESLRKQWLPVLRSRPRGVVMMPGRVPWPPLFPEQYSGDDRRPALQALALIEELSRHNKRRCCLSAPHLSGAQRRLPGLSC